MLQLSLLLEAASVLQLCDSGTAALDCSGGGIDGITGEEAS